MPDARTPSPRSAGFADAAAIGEEALERFPARQRRVTSALVAGLALTLGSASAEVEAEDVHGIAVVATVLRHASIRGVRAPDQVAVTARDVARGYLNVEPPITVVVYTNDPEGVVLRASSSLAEVSAIRLEPVAGQSGLSGSGSRLHIAKQGVGLKKQSVRLRVRLELGPGAAPGVIRWPLVLFLAPG